MMCPTAPASATELDIADVCNRVSRINSAIASTDIVSWRRLMREVMVKWPWAVPGDIKVPKVFRDSLVEHLESQRMGDIFVFMDGEMLFRSHKVVEET